MMQQGNVLYVTVRVDDARLGCRLILSSRVAFAGIKPICDFARPDDNDRPAGAQNSQRLDISLLCLRAWGP